MVRLWRRWRRAARWALVGAVIGGALAAYVVAIWQAPALVFGRSDLANPGLSTADRLNAEYNARVTVVSIGGALVVGFGLLFTAFNYRLARRGQVTDRFSKALERLGFEELHVRVGGIHALERIMRDSPDHHADVVEVLIAFVRDRTPRRVRHNDAHAHWIHPPAVDYGPEPPPEPPADVQAALTALGRRPPRSPRLVLNLRDLHLARANLSAARFGDANLSGADLREADLRLAQLHDADVSGADLRGAQLTGAELQGAAFRESDLRGADVANADFERTNLWDAKLAETNLTKARNIDKAFATVNELRPRPAPEAGGARPDLPKRLVICCDGSWFAPEMLRAGQSSSTNVAKVALNVARADAAGREQRVFYLNSTGNRGPGAFRGYGLSRDIQATTASWCRTTSPATSCSSSASAAAHTSSAPSWAS